MLKFIRNLRAVAQTRKELESLSDRDLADLGISRYDIGEIARRSVAEKV